jgi:hypothetical protein
MDARAAIAWKKEELELPGLDAGASLCIDEPAGLVLAFSRERVCAYKLPWSKSREQGK